MRKKDSKKLFLNKKTIANLNGKLMEAIKGGNRDPHDPTGGGGGDTVTCYTITCPTSCPTALPPCITC